MRLAALAAAALLCACSSASTEPTEVAAGQAEGADSGELLPMPAIREAPTPYALDAGGPSCVELGGACTSSGQCLCGGGAGCAWDNVACSSGNTCVTVYTIPSGVGSTEWQCCGGCQSTYDACMSSGGAGCMAAWAACNQTCGLPSACPVRCLAP